MTKFDVDDLLLLNLAGVGYIRHGKIAERFSSVKNALKEGACALESVKGIGPMIAQKIIGLRETSQLKEEWALISRHKIKVIPFFDELYPENLKNIYDPPIVLYVRGTLKPEDKMAVALVGSRHASIYGLNTCKGLSGSLAEYGFTIVSGLARGIDSAAHKGALCAGGRTIAVLGSGLAQVYPPENRKLADEIAESGALVSEFPMTMPPLKQNFPIRNRIISGLSLGVVVVEAAQKSGALITASCALEQGRDVFALPGRAGAASSRGAHRLIREGAKLVDDASDVIDELNPSLIGAGRLIRRRRNSAPELSGFQKKIYDMLSEEPAHIDSIIDGSSLPAPEVTRLLTQMEVRKLVKELPGKNFVVI